MLLKRSALPESVEPSTHAVSQNPQPVWRPSPPAPRPFPFFLFLLPAVLPFMVVSTLGAQQRNREESEGPHMHDANDREYKILRSSMNRFIKPELLRQTLAEEARYGWTMFEKIDDGRLRLSRPVSCRGRDAEVGGDPYRSTAVVVGDGAFLAKILTFVALLVVGVAALIWLIVRR